MNVVALLRVGRDPASFTVNRKAQKIFVQRNEWRIAPTDRNALEAALQLAEQGHALTAVAWGGEEAGVALREARAMGEARAVWVRGEALRNLDAGPSVAIFQRVMEQLGGADVVLLGSATPHADLAQVGPRLAVALGWPLIEAAYAVRLDGTAGSVTATVVGGKAYGAVRTAAPAVVTVALDANKPRYAPAGSIIRVHSDPAAVSVLSVAELGLDEAALAATVTPRGESYPPERVFGQVIETSAEEAAALLAAALKGRR